MLFTLFGCNANTASHTLSDTIDSALVATSGNKPPQFFAFASPYRANGYVMQHKDYSFTMPLTKTSDWSKMSGWTGAYIYGGIGIGVDNLNTKTYGAVLSYGINVSSSVGEYSVRKKAIEIKEQSYINNVRKKYQYRKSTKLYYGVIGKENYPCMIKERIGKRGERIKNYDCYKFNPSKTKSKSVGITLIYTKAPNLPDKYKILAKQYTYIDLQKRAKRMLDSLYIKDGW